MVKPFSIQAPEEIAKTYGGNKQKIAQAAQLGIVDPTAAVLAGMFIDRMRSAQMQENTQPPTVAQQVMGGAPAAPATPAPPSPAGGLGATPQAAPPMAPQAAPQGMAAGGMVPPYAVGGGLSDVPIPTTMFDEPDNGGYGDGYAGGGLVAFAGGSPGEEGDGPSVESQFDAAFPRPAAPAAQTYYGYSATDPMANAATYEQLFGKPQTKYADEYEQELLQGRSPEARKKARASDLGYALMLMGSKMASTPGSLFQSASAALGEGAPILMQSAKDRKAEDRELRKGLLDLEAGRNTAAAQKANALIQMQQMGVSGAEAQKTREQALTIEGMKEKSDLALAQLRERGDNYRAAMARAAAVGRSEAGLSRAELKDARKQAEKLRDAAYAADKDFAHLRTDADRAAHADKVASLINNMSQYSNALVAAGQKPIDWNAYALGNYNAYAKKSGYTPPWKRSAPNPGGPQVSQGRIISEEPL